LTRTQEKQKLSKKEGGNLKKHKSERSSPTHKGAPSPRAFHISSSEKEASDFEEKDSRRSHSPHSPASKPKASSELERQARTHGKAAEIILEIPPPSAMTSAKSDPSFFPYIG
jgi:hypothetical protein